LSGRSTARIRCGIAVVTHDITPQVQESAAFLKAMDDARDNAIMDDDGDESISPPATSSFSSGGEGGVSGQGVKRSGCGSQGGVSGQSGHGTDPVVESAVAPANGPFNGPFEDVDLTADAGLRFGANPALPPGAGFGLRPPASTTATMPKLMPPPDTYSPFHSSDATVPARPFAQPPLPPGPPPVSPPRYDNRN
jgi:hypothetical protein